MRFEISNEQVLFFQNNGYLHLPNVLTPLQLKSWKDFAEQLEESNTCSDGPVHAGAAVFGDVTKILMRQNDLHGINSNLTLELLSSPFLLAIARELCGKGAIPLQMDMFYKHPGLQYEVKWHRDALYLKANRFINIGVYLDDANASDGCLRYVPNSHKKLCNDGFSTVELNEDSSKWVEQTAQEGDVIIHDMRLLHGSAEKKTNGSRKTVYIEMSTMNDVLLEAHNSQHWAELRSRWMSLVLQYSSSAQWHPSWFGDYPSDLENEKKELTKIIEQREGPIPASYL